MDDRRIRAMIQAAASQSADETALLGATLAQRCWPRGGDRMDRIAREWLRRWAPVGMAAAAAECECATGRCGWCN